MSNHGPGQTDNDPSSSSRGIRSPRLPSHPILLHPLPPSSALQAESLSASELELARQIADTKRERDLAEALQEQEWQVQRDHARDVVGSSGRKGGKQDQRGRSDSWGSTKVFSRPPQAWELYQAIDKKDIEFVMRVRDHAFGLLLQKNAGEWPIVYAAKAGTSHKDILILMLGAMSRYVNHLEPEDFGRKETKNTLKALRSNLKIAIDHSLFSASSPDLLSSYLQVLIMSEGDSFLHKATYDISLLLRNVDESPVRAAEELVRGFCTKELRGVKGGVSGVDEYIANAALDLVMLAAWSLAAGQIGAEPLPTHTFARDVRTWTLLKEAMDENATKLGSISPRMRGVLRKMLDIGGDTKRSLQGRLQAAKLALDKHD